MSAQRILVVDDEPEIRKIIQLHLGRKGFEVEVAGGALEASNFLRSDRNYDLIVCDFRMPDGDGLEVFRNVRGDTPFILISGFADMDEDKIRELGIHNIIAKPVIMKDLIDRIRAALAA